MEKGVDASLFRCMTPYYNCLFATNPSRFDPKGLYFLTKSPPTATHRRAS